MRVLGPLDWVGGFQTKDQLLAAEADFKVQCEDIGSRLSVPGQAEGVVFVDSPVGLGIAYRVESGTLLTTQSGKNMLVSGAFQLAVTYPDSGKASSTPISLRMKQTVARSDASVLARVFSERNVKFSSLIRNWNGVAR
jgi:hypothetical protein